MRRIHGAWVVLVALGLLCAPVGAATVEEVVAKHIQARGGHERWAKVDSMKVTGSFTAFSLVSPFTLHRERGGKYHLDHTMNGNRVVVGSDGEDVWSDNAMMGPGPKPVEGADFEMIRRDLDFPNPFFDYKDKGYELELIGETGIEGIPAIGITLKRAEDSVETWYLDPETHLEIARTSPGSDFGRPMEQTTFWDDFRNVDGLVVPYLTESQFYTRDRVMRIETIETNLTIDTALFRMPFPQGMEALRPLVGEWKVAAAQRNSEEAEWQESESTSTIDVFLRGAMLQERFTSGGSEYLRTVSYDTFREVYRMTQIGDSTNHMDIRVGGFDDAGRLSVSNVETGTPPAFRGTTIHIRTSFFDITDDGFQMETETSGDGGETWLVAAKSTYTRATDEESAEE